MNAGERRMLGLLVVALVLGSFVLPAKAVTYNWIKTYGSDPNEMFEWTDGTNWSGATDPNKPYPNDPADSVLMNLGTNSGIARVAATDPNEPDPIEIALWRLQMANNLNKAGYIIVEPNAVMTVDHLYFGYDASADGLLEVRGVFNITGPTSSAIHRKGDGLILVSGDGVFDAMISTKTDTGNIWDAANPRTQRNLTVTDNGQMLFGNLYYGGIGTHLLVTGNGRFIVDGNLSYDGSDLASIVPGNGVGRNFTAGATPEQAATFTIEENGILVWNSRLNDYTDLVTESRTQWTVKDNAEVHMIGSHAQLRNEDIALEGGTWISNATWAGIYTTSVMNLSGGTLTSTAGKDFEIDATSELNLSGTGVLKGFDEIKVAAGGVLNITGGVISPGNSAGQMRFPNGLATDAAATTSFAIELGGTEPATTTSDFGKHDVIVVTGDADLTGSLDISLVDGFTPTVGDTFEIITATGALTTNFTNLEGILNDEIDAGLAENFTVFVGGGKVTLTYGVINVAPVVTASVDNNIIVLPVDTVNVSGTQDDDGRPSLTLNNQGWSKVSGPGTVTFGDPMALSTTAQFSQDGIYVLGLTADDTELTTTAEVTVEVRTQCQDQIINGVITPIPGDINRDCNVNLEDFADMAANWLACNDPAGC